MVSEMNAFFDPDRGVLRFLSRIGDTILLNLMFLLTSLPIFTIGASVAAMSTVHLKFREDREGYTVRGYFRAFRENFKKSTLVWLIMLAAAVVMGVDLIAMHSMTGFMGTYFRVILIVCAIFWLMLFLYVFVLQAKFENSVFGSIKNAYLLAFMNFPRTLWLLAMFVALVYIMFYNLTTFWAMLLILAVIGCALWNLINCYLVYPAIRKVLDAETVKAAEGVRGSSGDGMDGSGAVTDDAEQAAVSPSIEEKI